MRVLLRAGFLSVIAAAAVTLGAAPANAQQGLKIEIENNQAAGGFFLTPLWFGIHDGSFDFFDGNNTASASAALEAIAEEGDASGLTADFAAAVPAGQQGVILSPGGFAGAPVIDPGEIASTEIILTDPAMNQYFSFASMVIPTNDAFIGNDGAMDYELFDNAGNFTGPVTIQIFGNDIYDSGTEVNDVNGGAAFSANGGTSTSEALFVRNHPGLADFVGTFTVAGTEITSDIGDTELLATITISAIPEPGSLSVLGLVSLMVVGRRRRRRIS